ncbi:hypothetical protein LshimejAT787_1103600 [Lyophyllum shimeji]|uniref:Uncharacterized protein n=1 Tax=Lyophyllum shimeji TaxID=47721 RepID=A0A9P3PT55_LYOSH|nr:hypothetical protein LshimejAT787_1103600 [Lyophyllum shimeji]
MDPSYGRIFTYGYGSDGLPPTTPNTSPVDLSTALALQEAYDLAVEISCTPRALAVCSAVLKKSVADYVPGEMRSSLGVPLHAVAPPEVASSVTAWYRSHPFQVVVDINWTNHEEHSSCARIIYISGEIAASLSAAYDLKSAEPGLWRRHRLLTAIIMAREMFCILRYTAHCRMMPAQLARYASPALWSYTSGHHARPVQISGRSHIPGHAGWWWEDKVIGGSIEGLLYLPQDRVPDYLAMKSISASADRCALVPVALIKTIALRSGIIPGFWGELSQDTVYALADDPSACSLPLPWNVTPHQERTNLLPPHVKRGGDMVPIVVRRTREDRPEVLDFGTRCLRGAGKGMVYQMLS